MNFYILISISSRLISLLKKIIFIPLFLLIFILIITPLKFLTFILNKLGNYKDKKSNDKNFINELGNPFSKILTDPDGIISISLGAYGVPETFLLNNKSKVIRKYIGPLNNDHVLEIINIIKSWD